MNNHQPTTRTHLPCTNEIVAAHYRWLTRSEREAAATRIDMMVEAYGTMFAPGAIIKTQMTYYDSDVDGGFLDGEAAIIVILLVAFAGR